MSDETVIRQATKGIRCRFTLPLEMFVYASMLVDAISGSMVHGGRLYQALFAAGETPWWWLMLGPVAVLGLFHSAWEWFLGAQWCDAKLFRFAHRRYWLALWGSAAAAYQSYTLFITIPGGMSLFTVAWSGILALPVFWFIWKENRKVALILDEKEATIRLERQYAARNQSW